MSEEQWQCACGETDINKHDIGMVIAHEFEISEQEGRDILVRMRDSFGVETAPEDRTLTPPGDTT